MKLSYQIDGTRSFLALTFPTLVLHRTGDLVVPIHQARKLAEGIRGARFELPSIDH